MPTAVVASHLEWLEACIILIDFDNGQRIQQLHNELHKDFWERST